jgi:hypothetical protein
MSHSVYKYEIEQKDVNILELPIGASLLRIDNNQTTQKWVLWALVSVNGTILQQKKIRIFGTGHQIDSVKNLVYINTFFQPSHHGMLVWHAFEETNDKSNPS